MITGSLIAIREGLEAILIIGILLGYLTKINQSRLKVHVWIGAGAAFLVSILLTVIFQALAIQFEGEAAELFEAGIALLAVGMLMWMVLWMAAGLVGHSVISLQELGWLSFGTATAWDLGWLIPNDALSGQLLHAFIGYDAV